MPYLPRFWRDHLAWKELAQTYPTPKPNKIYITILFL